MTAFIRVLKTRRPTFPSWHPRWRLESFVPLHGKTQVSLAARGGCCGPSWEMGTHTACGPETGEWAVLKPEARRPLLS